MLSLRDVARLVGADVRWVIACSEVVSLEGRGIVQRVMVGFVVVSLEGRGIVRRMTAGFVDGCVRSLWLRGGRICFLNRRFLDVIISIVC